MSDDTVVQFRVYQNDAPIKPACTTCRHFFPDRSWQYTRRHRTWWIDRQFPFLHSKVTTEWTAMAIHYAQCGYYGGHSARTSRESCGGENWEAST